MQKLGLRVTGVDESAEMLAHLPTGVEGIQASIETLNLGRTWPAVLLPSHLINHPDPSTREQFVAAAKRHISSSGTFFVKRHSPEWLSSVAVGKIGESGPVTFYADRVERNGDLVMMTIRYSAPDAEWTQSFSTCALEQGDIESLLTSHGFGSFRWLGRQSLWLASTQRDA
jgi:hypothetical protein